MRVRLTILRSLMAVLITTSVLGLALGYPYTALGSVFSLVSASILHGALRQQQRDSDHAP